MRSVIISLSVFVLLLVTILCNALFLHRTTGEIEAALQALPAGEESEALSALEDYWKEKRTALSFSIVYDEIVRMDELLVELRVAAKQGDEGAFALSRAQALEATRRMRRLECFSLEALI